MNVFSDRGSTPLVSTTKEQKAYYIGLSALLFFAVHEFCTNFFIFFNLSQNLKPKLHALLHADKDANMCSMSFQYHCDQGGELSLEC